MPSLVNIQTVEDLKKTLFLQKIMGRKVKEEILDIAQNVVLYGSEERQRKSASARADEECTLFEAYAKQPTLTEFAANPELAQLYHWGATFGVTVIAGTYVLNAVKHVRPEFESVLRPLLLLLLHELDNPQHEFLVDPMKKALTFRIMVDNAELKGKERETFIQQLVTDLAEAFIHALETYKLVVAKGEKVYALTAVGRRVYLHLLDAQKFLDEMVEAHKRFQSAKPKLSLL